MTHKSRTTADHRCAILIAVLLIDCFMMAPGHASNGNEIDAKEAFVAAINYFPEKEYGSISNYRISISEEGDEWNVFFNQEKPAPIPGGHLIIVVSKRGKSIKLVPGE